MSTAITTSTAATATAYSNQRKVDRCQNGVLWMSYVRGTSLDADIHMRYSTDNGATWSADTVAVSISSSSGGNSNHSLFIDVDDYAHLVYTDPAGNGIRYVRGTPNASRTAWTWSSATAIETSSVFTLPDVVAHREGTGWAVHTVYSYSADDRTKYARLTVTSAGAVSVASNIVLDADTYGTNPCYPSLDFNHTGDGKTVAGSTPHIYAAWSKDATGAGAGIRFRKATYSAGSWTWGTEREIDSTRYVRTAPGDWLNCLFDGTRVVMGLRGYTGSAADFMLYERDSADTTTTTRTLNAGTSSQGHGSMSYDVTGNLYFVTQDGIARVVYNKWTRSSAVLGAQTVVDSTNIGSAYISAKRGYSNNRIEFIYTDGTASPYTVTYDAVLLNQAPATPTNLNPTGSIQTVKPLLRATVTDPDGGNVRAYFQVATDSGFSNVIHQGYGSTVASGTASEWRVPADLNSSTTYYFRALGEDPGGAQSAYSAGASFTTPAPVVATFSFTGAAQSFVVPSGVTSVAVDLHGAQGGWSDNTGTYTPARGGRVQGSIPVTPGETLQVNVGGYPGYNGTGGWNGGGTGGYKESTANTAGGGGGATDVRRGGTALGDRVAVAAGGGGQALGASSGGHGGGTTGNDGAFDAGNNFATPGRGGTQTAGGAGGTGATRPGTAGGLGVGGNGNYGSNNAGGGGGGGYYGGGGGPGADTGTSGHGGGGGGSSLVPSGGSTTAGVRDGHGVATLTYASYSDNTQPAPTAPTVTAPNGGEVWDETHTVTWTAGSGGNGSLTYNVEISENNGGSWTRIGTGVTGTSYTYNFLDRPATTAALIRVQAVDSLGLASGWDQSNATFTIEHNRAPNAPTLSLPANGAQADLAAGYTFRAVPQDPDAGDSTVAYAFRRKVSGAASYEFWNADLSAWQTTEVWNTLATAVPAGGNLDVVFASGKWTSATTYNWSVKTRDALGVDGPYAEDFTVTANVPPTVVVNTPSGTVTNTTRPTIGWTYTDPENQPQSHYTAKVFTEAQFTATGFSPATSTATWSSGRVASANARTAAVGTDLAQDVPHRAYVLVEGGGQSSAWAFSAFTINVTPPVAPTIEVEWEPALNRTRIEVQGNDAGPTYTAGNTTFLVEFSDNGGLEWTPLRDSEAIVPNGAQYAIAYDYEARARRSRTYRATTVGNV